MVLVERHAGEEPNMVKRGMNPTWSNEVIQVFVASVNSGCCRPLLYGCGYAFCRGLRWQKQEQEQEQIGQLMSAHELLSELLENGSAYSDGSTSVEGCVLHSRQVSEEEFDAEHTVSTDALLEAAGLAISRANVAATIAYPDVDGCSTFKMVSAGFEDLSGYSSEELLGKSTRFLTHSCPQDMLDVIASNFSSQIGAGTINDICIMTKHGDMKACRVLRRGLTLGFDPNLGHRMWVLLSVYVNLSDNGESDMLFQESEAIQEEMSKAVRSLDKNAGPVSYWHILPSCPWNVAMPARRSITAPA